MTVENFSSAHCVSRNCSIPVSDPRSGLDSSQPSSSALVQAVSYEPHAAKGRRSAGPAGGAAP